MGLGSGGTMQQWKVDYDYAKTLGLRIAEGRFYSKEFSSDSSAIVLNEAAVKQLGLKKPIGEKLYSIIRDNKIATYTIIGVVKDFHYESMHQDIGALALLPGLDNGMISFKMKAANVSAIISIAEKNWKTFTGGMPFSWHFLDDSFNEMYRTEERIGTLALIFSVLAIIIACLGLFGLANYFAEQRTKEIGVRKVLGASSSSIFMLLSFDFLKWVAIANIIALPLAYLIMRSWLEDYAYRINLSWMFFAAAGAVTIFIALATVSVQTLRSANSNPVKSLKYE